MILKLLIASAVIFGLCGIWLWFQHINRAYAKAHPELGRYREEGGECGKTCGCANWKFCHKKPTIKKRNDQTYPTDQTDAPDESPIYKKSTKESK